MHAGSSQTFGGKTATLIILKVFVQINSFSQDGTTFGGLFCYSKMCFYLKSHSYLLGQSVTLQCINAMDKMQLLIYLFFLQ